MWIEFGDCGKDDVFYVEVTIDVGDDPEIGLWWGDYLARAISGSTFSGRNGTSDRYARSPIRGGEPLFSPRTCVDFLLGVISYHPEQSLKTKFKFLEKNKVASLCLPFIKQEGSEHLSKPKFPA